MSREDTYNPILRFLQRQRFSCPTKINQKLFTPASSKQQFFTLRRNNNKKSIQNYHSELIKLNQTTDRKDSQEFLQNQWESVNVSQEVYLNPYIDDEVRTASTKSYDTHEDYQICHKASKHKKNLTAELQTNQQLNSICHNNRVFLNFPNTQFQVQNSQFKNQFSNPFLLEFPSKKQKTSKQNFLLRFKENLKKKSPPPLKIKHFIIFPKPLGQGTYSKVFKAIHKKTGMVCAIKVIEKQQIIRSNLISNLIEEIKIMSLYEHPHIARLWGYFEQGPRFYMVMQYCSDGDLYNQIKHFKQEKITEQSEYIKKLNMVNQICQAIQFLHENSIMHRDIKPENILLTMDNTVKLSDFGWARIIHHPSEELRKTLCGTPLYLAPQQIKQSQYSKSVDLWAIGILTYELLTGKIPFTIESIEDLHKIVNEDVSFQAISKFPYAPQFVSLLLQKDGFKRQEIHKLTEHPFLGHNSGLDQASFMFELEFGKLF